MQIARQTSLADYNPFGHQGLLGGDAPLVGYPKFGRENPFAPGGVVPALKGSYLRRLQQSFEPERRHFGLGDHITVPVAQLESQFTSALATTVEGLFTRARELKAAAETLVSGTPGGVFDRRLATSSDPAVGASARDGASLASYGIDVLQLALAQQNAGTQLLASQAPSAFAWGVHTFELTAGGVTTPISVTIAPTATNLAALTTVRNAINAASSAVEASIATTGDVSQLILTASKTGTGAAFSITDVPLGGHIIAVTGTGTATTAAADALVRVNGVEQALQQNRIELDAPQPGGTARLNVYLYAPTTATVQVAVDVAYDAGALVLATERLISSVNDIRSFVQDKPDILTRGLLGRLNVAIADLRVSLDRIGIRVSDEGAIGFDEPVFRGSLSDRPGDVERAIGSLQGFAARERAVAHTVLENDALAFATRPGPLGSDYGRFLKDTARLHSYVYGGLFVNLLA